MTREDNEPVWVEVRPQPQSSEGQRASLAVRLVAGVGQATLVGAAVVYARGEYYDQSFMDSLHEVGLVVGALTLVSGIASAFYPR